MFSLKCKYKRITKTPCTDDGSYFIRVFSHHKCLYVYYRITPERSIKNTS